MTPAVVNGYLHVGSVGKERERACERDDFCSCWHCCNGESDGATGLDGRHAPGLATAAELHATPESVDWVEGSFRFDSDESAVRELLVLGPEIEVLRPVELRATMATVGRRIARLHQPVAST
jgi:hypothetical protein